MTDAETITALEAENRELRARLAAVTRAFDILEPAAIVAILLEQGDAKERGAKAVALRTESGFDFDAAADAIADALWRALGHVPPAWRTLAEAEAAGVHAAEARRVRADSVATLDAALRAGTTRKKS